jgi:hypothetical protein
LDWIQSLLLSGQEEKFQLDLPLEGAMELAAGT